MSLSDKMEERYEVWQGNECAAKIEGAGCFPDAMHYAMQYGQDGIATVYKIKRGKKVFFASVLVKKGKE